MTPVQNIPNMITVRVPYVSRLYNSVNSQPVLDCNMSNSRSKHSKSENDKFKVKYLPFFQFEKLSYFEKKEGVWFSIFYRLELSVNVVNLQPIWGCNIPNFKSKHQQFRKTKAKLVSDC